jgi:uncharacterized protein
MKSIGPIALWLAASLAIAACDAGQRPAAPANATSEASAPIAPAEQLAEANSAAPALDVGSEFPRLAGRVVDEAGLLGPGAEGRLSERLAELERLTSDQLVIVTVPSLGGRSIADYSRALGNHWGVGKARANGVLLVVAPREQQVRIAVGRGLEPVLTNARAAEIIRRDLLPAFRDRQWEKGVSAAATSIVEILTAEAAGSRRRGS